MRNLLDNASRYAPRGSDIDVSLSIADGALTLTVTNPGKPIPAELRERVFEPYFRIAGTATEGSGLGLAIVREIARQHGEIIAHQRELLFQLGQGGARNVTSFGTDEAGEVYLAVQGGAVLKVVG